jgi:hypothetical protein
MSTPTAATPAELLAGLLSDLPTALPTTMTADGPVPTAGNDLYEAYLFGLVMRAACREGFSITLADAAGAATVFRLRRAPGRLPSDGSPGPLFTHALLVCPLRPPLELHTGVRVVGKSKVPHEADVLLLPQADADRCRGLNSDPRGSDAVLLIEAKYYTRPVGLNTGREFLGLSSEVSAKNKVFVATLAGESVVNLFAGRTPAVVHDIGVLPRRPAEDSLLSFIQRALRNYRSRR